MSAALVRKSLAIVDTDTKTSISKRKSRPNKANNLLNFIPDNQKLFRRITKKGHAGKVNALKTNKKLSVAELKKTWKSKEKRLKEKLDKISLIHELCMLDLGEDVTKQIIERAVTKKPIEYPQQEKEEQQTVFTEDDFQKFEAEYLDE